MRWALIALLAVATSASAAQRQVGLNGLTLIADEAGNHRGPFRADDLAIPENAARRWVEDGEACHGSR
jgi:hypothetical protein